MKRRRKQKVLSPSKRDTRKRAREHDDDEDDENEYNKKRPIELPVPMNGKLYGIGEFIDLVTTAAENSRERGRLIKAIQGKGYVKVGHNCIYKHLIAHYEGTAYALDEPWSKNGRPTI